MLLTGHTIMRYSKIERLIQTNLVMLLVMVYSNNKRTTNNLRNSSITLLNPNALFSSNINWVIFQANFISKFNSNPVEFEMSVTEENP